MRVVRRDSEVECIEFDGREILEEFVYERLTIGFIGSESNSLRAAIKKHICDPRELNLDADTIRSLAECYREWAKERFTKLLDGMDSGIVGALCVAAYNLALRDVHDRQKSSIERAEMLERSAERNMNEARASLYAAREKENKADELLKSVEAFEEGDILLKRASIAVRMLRQNAGNGMTDNQWCRSVSNVMAAAMGQPAKPESEESDYE